MWLVLTRQEWLGFQVVVIKREKVVADKLIILCVDGSLLLGVILLDLPLSPLQRPQ